MPIDLNATEDIIYKKSFVAFLDVLGFKNIVFANDKEKLKQYFGVINSAIEHLQTIQMKQKIGSIVISDSIILTIPHGDTVQNNISRLRTLCIAIGLIQQNLALKDIWLRGAISSGDTYFNSNNNQIVGPAYIEAYLLEQKQAINPRVIIDSKIISELEFTNATDFINNINKNGNLEYFNWGKRIIFNWLLPNQEKVSDIEQDIPLFIDYFSPFIDNKEDNKILEVINNIETNIYTNANVYSKYRWVTDYLKSLAKYGYYNHTRLSENTYNRLMNL